VLRLCPRTTPFLRLVATTSDVFLTEEDCIEGRKGCKIGSGDIKLVLWLESSKVSRSTAKLAPF
jgi:hypothetical protein